MYVSFYLLGFIGGTLGLFTGMSILSIVEMAFWLIKFLIRLFNLEASSRHQVEVQVPKVKEAKSEKMKKPKLRQRCQKLMTIRKKLMLIETRRNRI